MFIPSFSYPQDTDTDSVMDMAVTVWVTAVDTFGDKHSSSQVQQQQQQQPIKIQQSYPIEYNKKKLQPIVNI